MERSELDQTERGNLYAPHADNVFIVEASLDEARELAGSFGDDPKAALDIALEEAVRSVVRGAQRAFVVIKIA